MPWLDNWVERNAQVEDAKFWEAEYYKAVREFADEVNSLISENHYLKKQLKMYAKRTTRLEAENWQLRLNRKKRL